VVTLNGLQVHKTADRQPQLVVLAAIDHSVNMSRDLRTFECPKCDYAQRVLVEDPMKSVKTRWQDSGLKAPE